MKSEKKHTFYKCKHFEYEYDGFGKYCWCHNPKTQNRECDVKYTFCMKFCPYYKKDNNEKFTIALTDYDKEMMAEAKKKLAEWKSERAAEKAAAEKAEYERYLQLKKKYEKGGGSTVIRPVIDSKTNEVVGYECNEVLGAKTLEIDDRCPHWSMDTLPTYEFGSQQKRTV